MRALKETQGKPSYHLLIDDFIEDMINVRAFGAEKYDTWDWMKGREWSDYIDAIRRHVTDFNKGESVACDSGIHHMAHVAVTAMFLWWFDKSNVGIDNRAGVLAEKLLARIKEMEAGGEFDGEQ